MTDQQLSMAYKARMGNNDRLPGLLHLSAPIRGEYLAEIKKLARESYLRREVGSEEEFEKLWRQAFFAEGSPEPTENVSS
jgi:hypothetical protein